MTTCIYLNSYFEMFILPLIKTLSSAPDEVKVKSVEANNDVKVVVSLGGIISSKKGLNLPDTKISLPALTEKDLEDAQFIIKEELDWVALSFVKRVADIEMLREILNKHKSKSKIIAKIEMPEAIVNLRDIIVASDGIMVARGDLGVELPVEKRRIKIA